MDSINNLFVYWISGFILILMLFAIKWVVVYSQYKTDHPFEHQALYFLNDFLIIPIFLLLIWINMNILDNYNWLINTILLISCFHFFVDIICIKYFHYRAIIPDIFSFCTKDWFYQYWKRIVILLLLFLLLLIISFILANLFDYLNLINPDTVLFLCLISFFSYIIVRVFLYFMWRKIKFLWNIYTLNSIFTKFNWNPFSNYKKWNPHVEYENYIKTIQWEWKNLNVILVFAESLSAIDSKLLWWYDNMPWFDKIQSEWIVFKNYISCWTISIWAHVSTFQWVYPYQYETYEWFKNILYPLPKWFNEQWYKTTFISAAKTSFLSQRKRLEDIWFLKIIWEEEFLQKPHFSRNAAADWDLYERVLDEVNKQKWKFFIWLQTISFHQDFKDYNTPYWNTEKEALKYSDKMLYNFYLSLKKNKFFDSWILVIIWDHRKNIKMDQLENEMIGRNRYTKSVATVVWKYITPWTINNNIVQNTDFFHSIKRLIWNRGVEIDKTYNYVFWNEYNRNWWITINTVKILENDIFTISKANNSSYSFNKITRENVMEDEIYNHLTSQLLFQFKWLNINWKIYQ